jgi:hypothetical protein
VSATEKEATLQDIMRTFKVDRNGAERIYIGMLRDEGEQAILEAKPPARSTKPKTS